MIPAICFGSIGLGLIIGLIFTLLYVSLDSNWKKILTFFVTTGTSGTGVFLIYDHLKITDISIIFISLGCICVSCLVFFLLFMLLMCKIIKDKDNNNTIRVRDILLGQKAYITKYYEKRCKEIDASLNIPLLEEREKKLSNNEKIYNVKKEQLENDKADFEKLTSSKLRIKLPESKNLVVTKEFLDLFPSYVDVFSSFINGVREETKLFLSNYTPIGEKMNIEDFKAFLYIITIQVFEHLFSKNSRDVRVHFRYYNEEKNGYDKLSSHVGGKAYNRDLTFIPYNEANMIIKSFECKRALIKSYNLDYNYESKNNTTWTEYMTFTFYNITRNNKPCLSFGISVKNSTRYRNLFNFLNYCKFESYLQESIERIDESYSIESLIYGDEI